MDLSSPLRSLVPSLDSAVLEVLAGTESGLSASLVARLSRRGTRAGQAPVLQRLVEHGLVVAEFSNTGFLYRLNRDHVLASVIISALDVRSQIIGRLVNAITALTPTPVHASLFGSFARGEASAGSDIDLLIVTGDDVDIDAPRWTDQLRYLEDRVLAWTGNRLETLVFTAPAFLDVVASGEPIVESFLADSVTVHGDEVRTFVPNGAGQ